VCRHLAYVGEPRPLAQLLLDPPWSLCRQSYEPRRLDVGLINADGWGVGWYDPTVGPEPARYRTLTPMWADERFAGIAYHIRAGHVLAAVRNATPGLPVDESGAAPFRAGRWLFSHNGAVTGWSEGVGRALRRCVSDRREELVTGRSDSEVLFALVLDRLDAGAELADAVAEVVHDVAGRAGDDPPSRLNLLISDGETVAATRHGCSLFIHEGDGVPVASEPSDDGPGWYEVPERSLVALRAGRLSIAPL
jgi:gamma-glutamyl hercynylcysteine S-oxide hydrolase